MTRKKDKKYRVPTICTGCYQPIDRPRLEAAMKADQTFIHSCGKVLHWSREGENAEVPPHNHVLFDPNPKSSGSEQ